MKSSFKAVFGNVFSKYGFLQKDHMRLSAATIWSAIAAFLYLLPSAKVAAVTPPANSTMPQEIAALVELLGADNMLQRDAASRRLIKIGVAAKPQLQTAAKSENLLIRRRAKLLLASIDRRAECTLAGLHPGRTLQSTANCFRQLVERTPNSMTNGDPSTVVS